MTLRAAKVVLIFGVALFYTLVVINNLTDYNSNFQFVRHVMTMDSTLPGNHGMWRALNSPRWQTAFYVCVIAWESIVMMLCWWGGFRLIRTISAPASVFSQAKRTAVVALTLSLLMWLIAFLDIGGEWFLMWQSKTWNGQDSASRMFMVIGIVLLLLSQPESETQP